MGGNGPLVVLDDADVDKAVEASVTASFLCAGQSCTAGELFLVHEAVHDEFRREAGAPHSGGQARRPLRRGDGDGPAEQRAGGGEDGRARRDALDRGAELVAGGARASGFPTTLYCEPTVLDAVTEEMDVARDETFGPIVPIRTIARARRTRCEIEELALRPPRRGVDAGSRARSPLRRGRSSRVGERQRLVELLGDAPAVRRASGLELGIGRVGGRSALDSFTELKTVVLTLG